MTHSLLRSDSRRITQRSIVARAVARAWVALACVAFACAAAAGCHHERIGAPDDPAAAQLVTSDIDRFWRAYDAGGAQGSAAAFQREYLDHATPGLRDFARRRSVTAASLAQVVTRYPRYFAAVRGPMTSIATNGAVAQAIRSAYANLDAVYPESVFPPVTFLVGRFSTAGTTGSSGVLVGAEFYADATTPRDELQPFERANVHGVDSLVFIVAHESIHVQQARAGSLHGDTGTLLERALAEGSADFVGELVSGGSINGRLQEWALPREAALWAEFHAEMDGRDVSRWLYNQGTATADRPGDLGYFIGYRIAKAYYDTHADKHAAVRAIIRASDARAFLGASGYAP